MKTTIEVETKREGDEIRAGLADPVVRAFVRVTGTLAALPSDRARARVIEWVITAADDARERAREALADREGQPLLLGVLTDQ